MWVGGSRSNWPAQLIITVTPSSSFSNDLANVWMIDIRHERWEFRLGCTGINKEKMCCGSARRAPGGDSRGGLPNDSGERCSITLRLPWHPRSQERRADQSHDKSLDVNDAAKNVRMISRVDM